MRDEILEKVAAEIKRTRLHGADAQAKAALTAFLDAVEEPSEGMLRAGGDQLFEPSEAGPCFKAMVSELRKEVEG